MCRQVKFRQIHMWSVCLWYGSRTATETIISILGNVCAPAAALLRPYSVTAPAIRRPMQEICKGPIFAGSRHNAATQYRADRVGQDVCYRNKNKTSGQFSKYKNCFLQTAFHCSTPKSLLTNHFQKTSANIELIII